MGCLSSSASAYRGGAMGITLRLLINIDRPNEHEREPGRFH
jgi:hypothetical protein